MTSAFPGNYGTFNSVPRHDSYPSPRYNSHSRYATNTRINPPLDQYGWSTAAAIPPLSGDVRRSEPSYSIPNMATSFRSFSWSHPPPWRSKPGGVMSEDEFIEIDDNVFVHIVNGSPLHRGGECFHECSARKREETNHYAEQGLNYDQNGEPYFVVQPEPRRFDMPKRSRARGASTSTPRRPTTARAQAERPTTSSAKKTPLVIPKATDADARAHRIPAGYALKNWDPTETPILLLGSVFDANSLGKWIYEWTVFHHGPAMPISDVAGELWLLLIKLAGKVKRSEECMSGIRNQEDREMVDSFVDAGAKLMGRLTCLLKACEGPMLKAGRKKGGEAVLGKKAGVEFVET